MHKFEYRYGATCAHIEYLVTLLAATLSHATYGHHMSTSEVYNIYVVTQARAIGCWVVVAKDAQTLTHTRSGLRDVGYKVVGHTSG